MAKYSIVHNGPIYYTDDLDEAMRLAEEYARNGFTVDGVFKFATRDISVHDSEEDGPAIARFEPKRR